jgi:hypothetical protein
VAKRKKSPNIKIEIIGSTSSGKTTFGKELVLGCKAEGLLIEANKIGCAEQFGYSALAPKKSLGKPKWLRILSVLWNDLVILPRIIAQLVSDPRLYSKLFLSCLRRHDTIFKRINFFRNLIKRNTAYAMVQSKNKVHIIFDEGPFHAFTSVFAHYNDSPNIVLIESLADKVRQCDLIIHLDLSDEIVVQRAFKRSDAPWTDLSKKQWITLKQNTEIIYEKILKANTKIGANKDKSIIKLSGPQYNTAEIVDWLVRHSQI